MKFYLTIQFKRACRSWNEFGLPPIIGFSALIVIFIILSDFFFSKISYAPYLYSALALLLLLKAGDKNRTDFLKNCYSISNYKKLRLLENIILALPFFCFLIFKQAYLHSLVFILLAGLQSLLHKKQTLNLIIPTPFGSRPFEFLVGFRKNFLLFLFAYLVLYLAVTTKNSNLGLFSILIISFTCVGFYTKIEPSFYIWIFSENSKSFLSKKMKTAFSYTFASMLPILIILLITFSYREWDLILTFTAIGLIYVIASLLSKYHKYAMESSINNTILMGVSILFPPALLLIVPYFYKSSIEKLKSILK